jgi:hypothetical protein
MSEDSGREARALQLVGAVLDLPEAERESFLVAQSGGDAPLLEEARRLLAACLHVSDGDFLTSGVEALAAPLVRAVGAEEAGAEQAMVSGVAAALTGRYEFVREIGSGGSATVHLARDLRHPRDVAIKIVRHGLTDATQRTRFLHEISIAAHLRHPFILPLLDSGDASGVLYYVMPYVEGESLRQRLDRVGALSFEEAIAVARDVAEALDHAHASGVVHRDIKPQNILLSGGHALVADFGIALATESTLSDRITDKGIIVGTPAYMSPEQASAAPRIDGRTDIYSLGCVVYEMLSGEIPYHGTTPRAIASKHVHAPIPSLAVLRPTTTPALQAALESALAKSPADRFPTARAFVAALTESRTAPGPPPARPRWRRYAAMGGAALAILATVVLGRGLERPRWLGGVTPAPDTTVYALFPLVRASGVSRDLTTVVHDALGRWTGLRLLDPSVVAEATAGGEGWSVRERARAASALGAGRFVWGDVGRSGDSLRVHLRLSDAAARGLVLIDRVVQLPVAASPADSAVQTAIDGLLLRRTAGAPRVPSGSMRHIAARQSFHAAWQFVQQWNVDSAVAKMQDAVGFQPEYGQAHLWLAVLRAWKGDDGARYRLPAEQAVRPDRGLVGRERRMAEAILAESREDLGRACPLWRAVAEADSTDFSGWYGAARCHQRDNAVVQDRRSPSGWRFRTSMEEAVREHQTAFRLQPAILPSLRSAGFEPLRQLMLVSGPFLRQGRATPPDTTRFVASIRLVADSLATVPRQLTMAFMMSKATSPRPDVLSRQRARMREVASNWVSAQPQSADARHALAVSLAMLGDPTARDTLRAARRLATAAEETLRLSLADFWMRTAYALAGPDVEALRTVRLLGDSLLERETVEQTVEPVQLAAVAALLGRDAAVRFVRRGEVGRAMHASPALLETAPALVLFAAEGGPLDSINSLRERVTAEIDREADASLRASDQRQWLARAASLCHPECASSEWDSLRGLDPVLDLQFAFREGQRQIVRSRLRDLRDARRGTLPEVTSIDGLIPEVTLWLQLDEPRAAVELLAPTMSAASRVPPNVLATPTWAASVVRAMRLRSAAARRMGDTASAATWERAVAALRDPGDR